MPFGALHTTIPFTINLDIARICMVVYLKAQLWLLIMHFVQIRALTVLTDGKCHRKGNLQQHSLSRIKKVLNMKSSLILIAGPVRSGTNNRPELIDANLNNMAQVALSVYQKGHIPVVGEWLALPVAKAAGSKKIGDPISEEYLYPVAHRLISRCNAILRMPGESKGADLDIQEGEKLGLTIYYALEEIPDL